ncbi:hypothetical protein [Leptolyngbya iicbica]|uniref:Uncharacterized protein n=2 Tax=Cyanophyceae TaxID=3028117 RepID=A0A4Q7EFF6_9CYAN|nr:hypothetical protein [Leptolyngbya sp. LK]RZM82291.1 hypothetical protein DYY88_03310 [Leptolyngbya sp. LK]
MSPLLDKLLHFAIGLAVGMVFWGLLERYTRSAARSFNPIAFLIMLIWGASGLFFFRKLGVPIFSHTYFYMAFPDWDIPLYQATRLPFLVHRSWLFHSVLIPMGLLGLWLGLSQQSPITSFQRSLLNLLRDGAIGLSVGISAHLLWDALLSSTRRGFYIAGFGNSLSLLWLLVNLVIGIGIPLLIAKQFRSSEPSSQP